VVVVGVFVLLDELSADDSVVAQEVVETRDPQVSVGRRLGVEEPLASRGVEFKSEGLVLVGDDDLTEHGEVDETFLGHQRWVPLSRLLRVVEELVTNQNEQSPLP